MNKLFFELSVLAIASILLVVPATNLLSQPVARNVLILNTYDGGQELFSRVTEDFRSTLQRQFSEPIAFYSLNLDARWAEPKREELAAQLLRDHYADRPPDMVFTVGFPPIRFWNKYRDSISVQAPLIALAQEGVVSPELLRSGDIARITRLSFSAVVDNLLLLRPGTSHVVMVFGSTPLERAAAAQAKQELEAYSEQLSIEFTNDMTQSELQAKLGGLSEESAVYYGLFVTDADGVNPYDSGLSLTRLASAVPIFGTFDHQLGEGIVGGRLVQLQQISVDAAEAGAAILRGEAVGETWKLFELGTPVYDWRELNRWGIDIDRIPVGSEIRYRPPSLWDQYSAWIILAIAVVIAQGLLIVTLLTQRRLRHAAELAQKKLSGKLINAYEDERRSIARELHDDLSHRLARLAIDAGLIGRNPDSDALDQELKNLRQELATASEAVHDISYRLHPSLVEDLGISTALRTEYERVQKYTDASIELQIGEIPERIPRDAALCAYRVIQEALNNAVRHAEADNIEILLDKDGQTLKLKVSDDGRGFIEARAKSKVSLGLSSMRERVLMMDGTLRIRSTPGTGTTISAVVPIPGENT
jgi:signal transduction histidine kinase